VSFVFGPAVGAFPNVLIVNDIRMFGRNFDSSVAEGLRTFPRPVITLEKIR